MTRSGRAQPPCPPTAVYAANVLLLNGQPLLLNGAPLRMG